MEVVTVNRSLRSRRSLRAAAAARQPRTQRHSIFEPLETRQMMAADLTATGTFRVTVRDTRAPVPVSNPGKR